jgi:hypothetical protein
VGHKPNAIVAAIEKMADNVPREVETFDDILGFLTDLRDGSDSPDVFYLGQIPGHQGRFAARLDSLHTIQIPAEPEQRAFTDSKRIGHLHIEFIRDLHTRIFRAFATLGFDDHRWMSTNDLNWLVSRGRREVHDAEGAVENARTSLLAGEAQGFRHPSEKQKLQGAVTDAQSRLDKLRAQIVPYETEFATRQQPPAQI